MNNNKTGRKKRSNALYYSLAVCVVACMTAAFSIFGSSPASDATSDISTEKTTNDVKVAAPVTDVRDTRDEEVETTDASLDTLTDVSEVTTQTSSTVSELDMNIPYESVFVLPVSTEISWDYSDGEFVFSKLHGDYRQHNGVDFPADAGSSVVAIISGEVTAVIDDDRYGIIVEINHGNKLLARYCGLAEVAVSKGDFLKQGAKIGTVGIVPFEGEISHIHFETLIDGAYTDPLAVMGKAGGEAETTEKAESTTKSK